MPSRRGIALIMTMVVMAVLVTLTAAFVGVNRSNSALTGNTVSREAAFKACQTGLDYAWSQLELDGGFGANGFPDPVVSWSYPSIDPKLRITRHGNTLAPDNLDENYLSGQVLASGDSFRISLYNNLNNRNLAEDTPLGDVPGRAVRLRIDGTSGRVQRRLDVVLRKSPYVDSSAVSSLDMTVALSDGPNQWRLRSKDPYVNQVRSNTNIFGPSAIDDRLNFRDPPRGGMALAKDDIVLGGTSVKSSPTFLQNSQAAARGSFLVDAPEIPVPDLERSNLKFPETTVDIPPGNLTTTTFDRHEWSSATFGVDTSVPPDGIPDTTVTRWRKQVYRHPAMTHDGQTWIAETAYEVSDSGPLTGPGSGYASPDSSDGFQDVASQPASLDDFPVLYGTAPDHQMRANLLTGEVAL
ncbi:MAG: pilus assembly PilX N-terminal domain-containing protein, partial [Candidatus Eremiobacteraeota bacterium]|nr:pilus assembly PilX N-terminal domain-containing protein [Candidatus Eremiobacteraeota bacterium]